MLILKMLLELPKISFCILVNISILGLESGYWKLSIVPVGKSTN